MRERLQKLISAGGIASRRAAERMIQDGRVAVNGETATLGMSADPEADEILVDGSPLRMPSRRTYIVLNKPRGYVTTLRDDRGRPTVAELTEGVGGRLYPVGRLDMDSEGLLIMTDDGEAANGLMHPSHQVDKLYTVFVQGKDIPGSIVQLRAMDSLEGEPISPARVTVIERKGDGAEIQITIHEGKNRQIRRMCKACGLHVSRLIRVAEGPVLLGELPSGKWRRMTADEISFLKNCNKKG
ncbi:MAG: rRNA pseudouridine synthase [Oscillospiraceae bacterium]|nr:rRNA pseudouridine synthase [Oscillospiraceae bacterium]